MRFPVSRDGTVPATKPTPACFLVHIGSPVRERGVAVLLPVFCRVEHGCYDFSGSKVGRHVTAVTTSLTDLTLKLSGISPVNSGHN